MHDSYDDNNINLDWTIYIIKTGKYNEFKQLGEMTLTLIRKEYNRFLSNYKLINNDQIRFSKLIEITMLSIELMKVNWDTQLDDLLELCGKHNLELDILDNIHLFKSINSDCLRANLKEKLFEYMIDILDYDTIKYWKLKNDDEYNNGLSKEIYILLNLIDIFPSYKISLIKKSEDLMNHSVSSYEINGHFRIMKTDKGYDYSFNKGLSGLLFTMTYLYQVKNTNERR